MTGFFTPINSLLQKAAVAGKKNNNCFKEVKLFTHFPSESQDAKYDFFSTLSRACAICIEGIGLHLQTQSYNLTCVSSGQLGTSAGLWVKVLGSGNGTAQQGVSSFLGMDGQWALLSLALISTIWCAQYVQAARYPDTCLWLQIDTFAEADNLLLFVFCSYFANKSGLSEYSENNWQRCSRIDLMRVTSAFRKSQSHDSFEHFLRPGLSVMAFSSSRCRLLQHHLRSSFEVSGEEDRTWSPTALSPTHFV